MNSHLKTLDPIDFTALFGNSNPIELEIGTGRPHFLLERAQIAKDHNHVGLEWKARHVQQALNTRERLGLNNVWSIHANAWEALPILFGSESVIGISLHFPDPWWKRKHHKRRILNAHFIKLLSDILVPGGFLFFQTDVFDLYKEYTSMLENWPFFENAYGKNQEAPKNPLIAKSHREKKCIEKNMPVYRCYFVKIPNPLQGIDL